MVWFKVDDGFYSSKKVLSIPRTQRLSAVGLWTMAGNWSGRELSDGVVPAYVLDELGATPNLREALIKARLWRDQAVTEARPSLGHPGGGIEFCNWAEYQPTRGQVEKDRADTKERQRRHREQKRDSHVSHTDVTRDSRVSHSAPTRPDPTRPIEEAKASSSGAQNDGKKPEIRLPKDWAPTASHYERAKTNHVNISAEVESFTLHAETHDRHAANWNSAFTTWLTKAKPNLTKGGGSDWALRM